MRLTALGVSAAIIAGGTWISLQALSPSGTEENYRTAPGEQQEIALTDGSRVTLDTDGAVDVRITRTHRIVHLDQGQVLVDVMRDPNKPFVVETPEGTATALGTAFIVRRDKSGTLVTVTRSHVRVCPVIVDGRALCRTLGPGERARLNAAAVQMEARVDPAQASLWTEGWLEADDRPVTEVLAELNRYRARPVRFDAAKLSGLRVTGSYSLRDTDRAVEGIAHAVDLVITSLPGGDLSLRRGD
nr:FecR domain-containing protein [Sphingomonas sp. dw_22]